MVLSNKIIELLRVKSGSELSYSSDIEGLSIDIEAKTNEHIGVNTLKRLLGFISDERAPRLVTLDIIARYLGYASWDVLEGLNGGSNSDFNTTEAVLDVKELEAGQDVEICYQPGRRVIMRYTGDQTFIVEASENSKLKSGDMLHISYLANNYPLYVSNVIRDGESIGNFTAGKVQGIQFRLL